jgi:anti-anti-sigma factor
LTGLLDAFSEPVFRKVVSQYVETGAKHIILVLAQIEFVDSSGIGALVHLFKQTKNVNGSLQIVTNPRVTQTVKLMRLEKFLTLRTSLEDAIAHIPDQ